MRTTIKNDCSRNRKTSRTRAKSMVILFFFLGAYFTNAFGQVVVSVNPPTGGFNIDGTLKANTAAGDWAAGTGAGGFVFQSFVEGHGVPVSGLNAGWIPDAYNSTADLIFSGSAFADNPNTWKWTASKPSSKDDINNVMYLSTTSSTQKWLILGGDRFTTTGTSYIDFEFFQGKFTRETAGKFKSVGPNDEDLSGTGGRSLGDFVLSMEYSNGGTNANVHYYIWEAVLANGKTTYKYVDHTDLINSSNALGSTNGATTPAAFAGSAFGSDNYIPYAFVEAAVNVDALLGLSCHQESIKTLFIKTKASDSYTAALKDFVDPQTVNFTFGSTGLDYGGTSFCKTGTASPTTPNPVQGSFTWTDVYPSPQSGTLSIDGTTGAINLANSDTGTYKITYTPSGGVCLNPSDVTIKIKPLPTGSATNQSICSGGTSSVTLNSTVASTSFTWTAAVQTAPTGGSLGGYSDCTSSCGTSIAQNLTNGGTTNGVLRYTVVPTAAGCAGSSFTVDVTVKPIPSGSSSNNSAICSGSTTAVNLSSTVSSTSFTWTAAVQTAPTGGSLGGYSNCTSSCGTSIAQNLTNGGTTSGVVRYVVTPTANSCAGSTFNVDVTVKPIPTGSATNQSICSGGTSSVALNSTVSGTTFTWTAALQSGTVTGYSSSSGTPIAQTLTNGGTTAGVVRYTVTPTANSCPGSTFTVDVTVTQSLSAPSVTYHPPACYQDTFSITINSPIANATYTLKNKNDQPITQAKVNGVTTNQYTPSSSTSFDFTNIPAGSGYRVTVTVGTCSSDPEVCDQNHPTGATVRAQNTEVKNMVITNENEATVKAYPNPFNDRIKFLVNSQASGEGSLEVYNIMGQKVKTVYQGHINTGNNLFELTIPKTQQATLIYVFRIGDKKVTGKLLQLNN